MGLNKFTKTLSALAFFFTGAVTFAQSTTLHITIAPSPSSIGSAIGNLMKAKKLLQKDPHCGEGLSLVNKAVGNLNLREAKVSFKASFYVGREKQFLPREDGSDADVLNEPLCYRGQIQEALRLLEAALKQNHWHWDESWMEKPTIKGSNIEITWRDGPNESSENYVIYPCASRR